ncbi:bifunctional DNA-formamidopyrimidine glycosylase/DNA-(apurinic or apyrimidinic site) lyase [Halothiobacillus sp. DCM-1]|uniref:bifunctional DNA-formamidopyrimidine glycosylase/DNA-(apurinic or apyrimidinic site) lyase n=1 Tax=Halothiobacillus sp. DCM-1 TaxID=3112558 RepID=UPI00324A2C3E
MPELPEVETTRRGIEPHLLGRQLTRVTVYEPRLRWRVRDDLSEWLTHRPILAVGRRAKYLLLSLDAGERLLIHLGMSGSLRLVEPNTPRKKHDHIELELDHGHILRYHDPRRFGAFLTDHEHTPHARLQNLGPEPLSAAFDANYLYQTTRRDQAIKVLLMSNPVVVGVGNIYANEALFMAGIHPARAGKSLNIGDCLRLSDAIKTVLTRAIEQGGTTLRDFVRENGQPGYFQQTLQVYDRTDAPCRQCQTPIARFIQAQRASFYCPVCQH